MTAVDAEHPGPSRLLESFVSVPFKNSPKLNSFKERLCSLDCIIATLKMLADIMDQEVAEIRIKSNIIS